MRRRVRYLLVAALALSSLVLAACSSDDGADDGSMPVLFSSDMAMGLTTGNANGTEDDPSDVDDSWAFALAATHDELDVRGVVVTMGNNLVAPEMTTAQATVDAMGSDVPVVRGASVWLSVAPLMNAAGEALPRSCVNEGVEFMADELRGTDDLTIIAIGPLTDVACLAMNFPDEAARIKEVVALVGSEPDKALTLGDVTVRDFNYAMDPRAEQVVLESEIPFTAIMFEASSSATIPTSRITALADGDNDRARFFGEASTAYAEFWEQVIGPRKPLWDANVVWYLLRPDAYECAQAGYRLQTGPPNSPATAPVTDWFSPRYTGTRQVTACSAFSGPAAIDTFNDAVLTAVGGS